MANEAGITHLLNFKGKGKGFFSEQEVEASLFESENGIDVAISFDTTGSMWPVFQLVKEKIQETCTLLLEDIPNLRIAIMAHGDYGEDSTGGRNTLRILDFTRNIRTILEFVNSARMTNGEDWEECYEYVLNRAQKLTWGREHNKTLIMIGDAVPHPPSVTSDQIWWRDEVEALYRFHGVKIYAVQAYECLFAKPFWIELARRSGGIHLTLDKFSIINDMFRAMCYLQSSPELLMKYRDHVIREKRMTGSLLKVFDKATFTKPPPPLKTWYPLPWWNLQMDRPGLIQFVWDTYRKRYLPFVPKAGERIPANWISKGRFEAADAEVKKEAAIPTASTRVGSAILDAPSAYVIKKFNEQNAAKKEAEEKKENEQYVLKKVGKGIFELVKGDASLAPAPVAKPASAEDEDDLNIPLKKEMGPPPEKHHKTKDAALKVDVGVLERFAIARLQRDLKDLIKNPMYNVSCLPLETDFMEWHGNLSGPSGTPYDGIVFHFRINFPNNYPNSPPGISLYTQVFHPNVYGTWLCLDMLELGSWGNAAEKDQLFTGWSTAYTVSSILAQLQSFLFQGAWTDSRYIEESRKKSKIFSCMKCGHHTDGGKNVFPPFPKIVGHKFPKTMPLLPVNKKKTKAPVPPPPKSVQELKQEISEAPVDAKILSDADAIHIDDLILGTVESVKPELGAFVKISESRTGLLHNSNMDPGKIVKGQKIPVYVDSVDQNRGRLGLSTISDTLTRVWRRQVKIFYSELKEEECRVGEIVDVKDAGVLVNVGVFRKDEFKRTVNVKAFLHRSEMGWTEGNVGTLLKVWVKKLDPETFGIKLSTMDASQRTGFITRLENAILQNYNDPAKPKPPVEDRSYDALAFSHLSWMPVEILFMMMDYLTPIDVMRWGTTCKYLRRLCEDGHPHLFEKDEVVCFHTKLPYTEDVLGVGVNPERKINGKLAYITCTFDLLSATAFDQEKVRKASYKEKFSHWMPLCITADHAKRSMPLIQRSLSLICTGKPDQFEPDQILEVIPKLMNTFVVSAMSGKLYASMMALDGYIAFHHLFLTLLEEYPELRVKIDAEIASFCESQKTRHKKRIAALGDFIPLLTVTETYQWKDVAVPYLLEMFDRNVLWTLKAHPQYREPSPVEDWVRRLGETFSATKVSNRLLMFHVYFLRHIARPDGMTLDQIKAVLDSRFGRPTAVMRERLLLECKRIQKVNQWETFFWKINLTPPSEATLIHWFHESLRNSSRRKYHNPDDFTPAAIALRKKLEAQAELELSPKVAVNTKAQEKKKRVAIARDDDDKYYDKLHTANRSGWY